MASPDLASSSGSTAFSKWAQSRKGMLALGWARDAALVAALWVALVLVAISCFATLGNALPGVKSFDSPRTQAQLFVSGLGMTGLVIVMSSFIGSAPIRSRVPRALSRTRALARRLLRDVLGLAPLGGRRLSGMIGLGLIAGLLGLGVSYLLGRVPFLAASVPATDTRVDAVAQAPAWIASVFFATYAPVPEEILFRGPLLAAVVVITALAANKWVRRILIAVVLVGTSWVFGMAHLEWSLLNAVSAGAHGMLLGGAAVTARSLWPAIVGHVVFNAFAAIV